MCCLMTLKRHISRSVLPQYLLLWLPRAHCPRKRSPHRHLSLFSPGLHFQPPTLLPQRLRLLNLKNNNLVRLCHHASLKHYFPRYRIPQCRISHRPSSRCKILFHSHLMHSFQQCFIHRHFCFQIHRHLCRSFKQPQLRRRLTRRHLPQTFNSPGLMIQAAEVPRIVQNRSETAPLVNHQTNLPVSQNIIQAKRNTCSFAFR